MHLKESFKQYFTHKLFAQNWHLNTKYLKLLNLDARNSKKWVNRNKVGSVMFNTYTHQYSSYANVGLCPRTDACRVMWNQATQLPYT